MTVGVGTNCPQGGDRGHGGRTTLRISVGGGYLRVGTNGEQPKEVRSVQLYLDGDAEAECLVEALEFAARTARSQLTGDVPGGREEEIK